jgi:hypothetical protein
MVNEPAEPRPAQPEPRPAQPERRPADDTRLIVMGGVSSRPGVEDPAPTVAAAPVTLPPLVILATDDQAVCVDDLCLPPDAVR